MNTTRRIYYRSLFSLIACPVLSLAACQSSSPAGHADATATGTTSRGGDRTVASDSLMDGGQANVLPASSTEPIAAERAILAVRGMSCPKCANNITLKLNSVPNVSDVAIDMGKGDVTVSFVGFPHPSPSQLAQAIDASGFTLASVRVP